MNTTTNDLSELTTAHEQAGTTLEELQTEQDTITGQMRRAALAGDADRYCELKARRHELPDRIKIARLVFAETGLELARAELIDATARDDAQPTFIDGRYTGDGSPLRRDVITPLESRVHGFIEAVDAARKEFYR